MPYVRLEAKTCQNSGKLGLFVAGMKSGFLDAATTGDLVAHDILEHQNGTRSIGGICDELEALGGVWFVRGQHGYLRDNSNYTPQEDLAGDVAHLFSYVNAGCSMERHYNFTHRHDFDEDFRDILELAEGHTDDEEPMTDEYKSVALHAMRTGFRKASRRFLCGISANSMFRDVREAVDSLINREMECEGQVFLLEYNYNGAWARELYSDEYEVAY